MYITIIYYPTVFHFGFHLGLSLLWSRVATVSFLVKGWAEAGQEHYQTLGL